MGRDGRTRQVRAVLAHGVRNTRAREPGSTSGPLPPPATACCPVAGRSPATMALPPSRTASPAPFDNARHFDNAQLPYRWVPGLEVRRLPEAHYRTALRLEVSHTFDWTPGPLWLYGAPGSGVWWDPGSRVIARNMADAAVRWHGVAKVAAALRAQATTNPDYPHWHAAFGQLSWEAVVLGVAALTLALTPTPALTLTLALTVSLARALSRCWARRRAMRPSNASPWPESY
jgi:hypothetical protein